MYIGICRCCSIQIKMCNCHVVSVYKSQHAKFTVSGQMILKISILNNLDGECDNNQIIFLNSCYLESYSL